MKKTVLLFALFATTLACFGQTKPPVKKPTTTTKPVASKFGALAIDRNNGLYYGWSFDYTTLAEAEKKAIEECNAKGGNCTVVLSYSGTGCAAYRTIEGKIGTAYGWGLAKTKEEADAIATKECLKRSNGIVPKNFVWSCNSANTGQLKEIYNASEEIFMTVKIGNQEWAAENLSITKFKNGDPIPVVKTNEEWLKLCKEKKPACMNLSDLPDGVNCGIIYNVYAVNDPRELGFEGWQIPTKSDWDVLVNYLGGKLNSGLKLASKDWTYTNGNNATGFNGKPCDGSGGGLKPTYAYGIRGLWWSRSPKENSKYSEQYGFSIRSYDTEITAEVDTPFMLGTGRAIRLIKNK